MTLFDLIKQSNEEEMGKIIADNFCCGCYFTGCSYCFSVDQYDIEYITNALKQQIQK